MSIDRYSPKPQAESKTFPFDNAEQAWLWFVTAQEARNEGARFSASLALTPRPCEPMDILKCVERLYRNRRLIMDHLLVLRHYGKRQLPPDPRRIKEARACVLWREALERIEPILEKKGIILASRPLVRPDGGWLRNAVVYQGGLNI